MSRLPAHNAKTSNLPNATSNTGPRAAPGGGSKAAKAAAFRHEPDTPLHWPVSSPATDAPADPPAGPRQQPLPRPSRWPRPCPVCGHALTRQRRHWMDRVRSLVLRPVLRYRCVHASCGWYGLLQSG